MGSLGRTGAGSSLRTECFWIVALTNLAASTIVAFLAFDVEFHATSDFGRRLSVDLLIASAGAMALTTLPGLLLVKRWALPSLALALAYPIPWIGIVLAR